MENEEIDLIEVLAKLWRRKRMIVWFVLIFMTVGLVVAFILPRQYTARCTLGLEMEDKTTRISVEGMSAFQSMNLGDVRHSRIVSPSMYPNILFSVPFQKELIYTPLFGNGSEKKISFYDYYLQREGVVGDGRNLADGLSVMSLTKDEERCLTYLEKQIDIQVNAKENNLKLEVSMLDPQVAAGLAEQIQRMLQDYITRFRVAKVQTALEFIESRYEEIKSELEIRQKALIDFRENHRGQNSVKIEAQEKILDNDYNLYFELYADLVKQREKAKIQVKEDMPVLTLIEPVVLPTSPSKPQRGLILLASVFLGLFVGCGGVLIHPVFSEIISGKKPSPAIPLNRMKKIS